MRIFNKAIILKQNNSVIQKLYCNIMKSSTDFFFCNIFQNVHFLQIIIALYFISMPSYIKMV